jgi:gluconolactonase
MQITRRDVLGTGAAAAAAATAFMPKETLGGWEPSTQYPDPAVKILDPSFARYRVFNASVERLATGMRWSEGPVWFGDARCVLWSDIPNNRMMRWDEEAVELFERQYPRPPGPARHLRARRQARDPHRV